MPISKSIVVTTLFVFALVIIAVMSGCHESFIDLFGEIQWICPDTPPQWDKLMELIPASKIPVHLIYIPWNKDGTLKANELEFDQTFAQDLQRQIQSQDPRFFVKMWTRSELQKFSELWCPGLWDRLMRKIQKERNHPVMLVDFYRWLVVYCYGGIYWQYESKLLCNIADFLPTGGRNIKLFTETILSESECIENGRKYPIRKGIPEEALRIYTSIFFAPPQNQFVALMLDEITSRLNTLDAHENYDILYITGNAVLPTVYDREVFFRDQIELVPMDVRDRMIGMSSHGTWRR